MLDVLEKLLASQKRSDNSRSCLQAKIEGVSGSSAANPAGAKIEIGSQVKEEQSSLSDVKVEPGYEVDEGVVAQYERSPNTDYNVKEEQFSEGGRSRSERSEAEDNAPTPFIGN